MLHRCNFLVKVGVTSAIFVFCFSCSSKYWVMSSDIEKFDGRIIHRLETVNGDTVVFAWTSISGVTYSNITGESTPLFSGDGGVYADSSVSGVIEDGSEVEITLEDITQLELQKFNPFKAVLYVVGPVVIYVFFLVLPWWID